MQTYASQETQTDETEVATSVSSAEDARNGVLQVNSVYVDDSGANHIIQGGAGFLIGSADDTEYIITANHIVSPDTDTKDAAYTAFGISNDNNEWDNINPEIQIVVANDVVVGASIVSSSTELDMAVLELDQPIYNRTPLTIVAADDSDTAKPYAVMDSVYALGFPAAVRFDTNPVYYTEDKVSISSGTIANLTTLNDIEVIEHDANIASNNCGGPLVNKEGQVIGMNELSTDGNYYTSLDASAIVSVLDALGLSYSKITTSEINAETETVETAEQGTEETIVETSDMSSGIPIWIVLIICILIVAVIAMIAVLLILLLKRNQPPSENSDDKKKNNKKKDTNEAGNRFASSSLKNDQIPTGYPMQQYGNSQSQKLHGTGSMETSVLGCPDLIENETTILGVENVRPSNNIIAGTLIRRATGENIILNKPIFRVGKDSLHSDYCIKDNSSISRMHAVFRVNSDGVYLEDCHSTNGTFLNNNKVLEGQPVKIKNGDIIRLAKDEFEYRK